MYKRRRDPWYSPHLSLVDEGFNFVPRTIAARRQKPIPMVMTALSLNCEGAPWSQYELTKELVRRKVIQPIVFSPVDGPLRSLYEEEGIPVMVDRHPLWGVTTLKEYEEAVRAFSSKWLSWGAELAYANTLQSFYAVAAAHEAGLPSVWNPRESEPWQTYFDTDPPDCATLTNCRRLNAKTGTRYLSYTDDPATQNSLTCNLVPGQTYYLNMRTVYSSSQGAYLSSGYLLNTNWR